MSLGSRNPFRTRLTSPAEPKPPTPGPPPGSPPPATTPPRAVEEPSSMSGTTSRPPNGASPSSNTRQTDLEALSAEPMEEPPPYTPAPSAQEGEFSLEYGPNRPFQPPPPRPVPPPAPRLNVPSSSPTWVAPNNTGLSSSSSLPSMGNLMHQLTSSITNAVNNLNGPRTGSGFITPHTTGRSSSSWSSYPGGSLAGQRPYQPPAPARPTPGPSTRLAPPPPRHPFSQSTPDVSSTSRNQTSDFARDFYAAGTGEDVGVRPNNTPHLPPLPSRPGRRSFGSTPAPATNDGRPTTQPSLGHPLLKDGKLLVYPRGYICEKCHNIGYKNQDPLRPCKKCWGKYAKTFSGPLVYSFSPDSPAENFQRPLTRLPPPAPPPIPPAVSLNPPPAHFAPGGYLNNHHGGFFSPPVPNPGFSRPPPGAIVYAAGDPRIGGRLCWRCDGKGNVSLLFLDRMTCDVCGGIGRTFN